MCINVRHAYTVYVLISTVKKDSDSVYALYHVVQ